ncbi:MAG: hypothetical protein E7589_02625 [Ruminococcaceae bacterium]|nr:hypothetical protein [Oscillospiraceae bacterium]
MMKKHATALRSNVGMQVCAFIREAKECFRRKRGFRIHLSPPKKDTEGNAFRIFFDRDHDEEARNRVAKQRRDASLLNCKLFLQPNGNK